jgi:hypothetical protein
MAASPTVRPQRAPSAGDARGGDADAQPDRAACLRSTLRGLRPGHAHRARHFRSPMPNALVQDEIELVLQINGKLRGSLRVPRVPTGRRSKPPRWPATSHASIWPARRPRSWSSFPVAWSTSSSERKSPAMRAALPSIGLPWPWHAARRLWLPVAGFLLLPYESLYLAVARLLGDRRPAQARHPASNDALVLTASDAQACSCPAPSIVTG